MWHNQIWLCEPHILPHFHHHKSVRIAQVSFNNKADSFFFNRYLHTKVSVNYTAKMLIRVLQVFIPQTEEMGRTHTNEEASERAVHMGRRTWMTATSGDNNNNNTTTTTTMSGMTTTSEQDGDNKQRRQQPMRTSTISTSRWG